jgi:2'-5' RNA ligase
VASGETGPFGGIRLLRDHWAGPTRPRAYYWYFTFASVGEVCALAARCQQGLAFPYYDLVPPQGLHMTLDRIAPEGGITGVQLNAVAAAARLACQTVSPFRITLGKLSGTRGAVGFTVTPAERVQKLVAALRAATLSVCPDASVTSHEVQPHVTIAYGNTDNVPAVDAIAAVEKLNASAPTAKVVIEEAELVLLERRERSYVWERVSRIPLAGLP